MADEKWFAKPVGGHSLISMYQRTGTVFCLSTAQAKDLVEQLAQAYCAIEGKVMFPPSTPCAARDERLTDESVVVYEEHVRSR